MTEPQQVAPLLRAINEVALRTDVQILEELGKQLAKQLSGMMGNVKVCNTETLHQFLLCLHSTS
jgi:hypothetical protein